MPTHHDLITRTQRYVREELYADSSGHDWWHVYRVWSVAKKLAEIEGANSTIVELAALLHDISDYKLNGNNDTAATEISRQWLTSLGADPAVVNSVCNIIGSMGFKRETNNSTLEAVIVFDADRLDAIGAIGIARVFAFGGFKGDPIYEPSVAPVNYDNRDAYIRRSSSSINHFYEKLLHLKDSMHTATARRVAEHRHEVLVKYLEEFLAEWGGSDVFGKRGVIAE